MAESAEAAQRPTDEGAPFIRLAYCRTEVPPELAKMLIPDRRNTARPTDPHRRTAYRLYPGITKDGQYAFPPLTMGRRKPTDENENHITIKHTVEKTPRISKTHLQFLPYFNRKVGETEKVEKGVELTNLSENLLVYYYYSEGASLKKERNSLKKDEKVKLIVGMVIQLHAVPLALKVHKMDMDVPEGRDVKEEGFSISIREVPEPVEPNSKVTEPETTT